MWFNQVDVAWSDFQTAWTMFDHVKRVEGSTTLTCHVYDSFYYKVMMIAICDMQSKDIKAQMCNVAESKQGHDK